MLDKPTHWTNPEPQQVPSFLARLALKTGVGLQILGSSFVDDLGVVQWWYLGLRQEGPPVLGPRPAVMGIRESLTEPMRDRSRCSPMGNPPPNSKPKSPTRCRVGTGWNFKFGGLDMLQPVVDRRQGERLYSVHRWRLPQSTSACELLVHDRAVLPASGTTALKSLPTLAAK